MKLDRPLEWAAGLYVGEGCCNVGFDSRRFYKNSNYRGYPRIQIGMADKEALLIFQEAVGGFGLIHGPYKRRANKTWREIYEYNLQRKAQIMEVINKLYPFLSKEKKNQIRRTLNECEDWD